MPLDYYQINGKIDQITPTWLDGTGIGTVASFNYVHFLVQSDGIVVGGGNNNVKSWKMQYGDSDFKLLASGSMSVARQGAKGSLVMGGIFVSLGKDLATSKYRSPNIAKFHQITIHFLYRQLAARARVFQWQRVVNHS